MTDEPEQPGRRFATVESDRFEADWERANEWAVGLSRAIVAFPKFPRGAACCAL